jgi:ABC-type uncharacterized transport system substrate-binding protein
MHPELSGKRLELLKAAVPKLLRLAVLWNGANPYKAADMKEVQTAAHASGVTVQSLPVKEPQDLETAFGAAKQGRADALITLEDPFTIAHRIRIVELTRTHRLPALYGRRVYVDAGGLMSYGPDLSVAKTSSDALTRLRAAEAACPREEGWRMGKGGA